MLSVVVPVKGVGAVCSDLEIRLGLCGAGSIGNGEVIIGGEHGGEHGGGGGGGENNGGDPGAGVPGDEGDVGDGIDDDFEMIVHQPDAVYVADAITVSDLARFSPEDASVTMEPDGWALIGLPANFVVTTGRHTVNGTLFGHDLIVRFTPNGYDWRWGDGMTTRTTTPGSTWAAGGLPEFSETPTSHVFSERGSYAVSVTVSYTVEFSIADLPWRGVSGTLNGPAAITTVVAGTAKTVLVDGECTRDPTGPGC